MKVLAVNSGSSSLKFKLFEMPSEKVITYGIFERIGEAKSFYKVEDEVYNCKIKNHKEAIKILMEELINKKIINSLEEIEAIGHRVVHGGDNNSKSTIINSEVIKDIFKCIPLAPLHNPANLEGIKAFIKVLPKAKHVAVFDTAFNTSMAKEDYLYGVPYEWNEKYKVRKYGFHGISYNYLTLRLNQILGRSNTKLIICHLGNGASVAAIKNGKVVSNSMGFSPSSGLVMGSRAGDIDFMIIPYLMKEYHLSFHEIINSLNNDSGLLGISGISNDSRDIEEEIKNGNERAILARDIYIDRVVSYIASSYVKLGGADAICFSAGIGSKSDYARKQIISKLKVLGIKLNDSRNKINNKEVLISTSDSKVPVFVLPTNEELMISRDTYNLVK
jgi:acetate kinase